MPNVIVVGYDASPSGQRAVEFAKGVAKDAEASLVRKSVINDVKRSFHARKMHYSSRWSMLWLRMVLK